MMCEKDMYPLWMRIVLFGGPMHNKTIKVPLDTTQYAVERTVINKSIPEKSVHLYYITPYNSPKCGSRIFVYGDVSYI